MPVDIVRRFAEAARAVPSAQHLIVLLDELVAKPLGLRVYAAWRVPINDQVPNAYQVHFNVFYGPGVPAAYWREFWPLIREHGTSLMARLARRNLRSFSWSEGYKETRPRGRNRWFHELTKRYKMPDGFSSPHGDIIVAYYSKSMTSLNSDSRDILDIAARITATELRRLMAKRWKKSGPGLSHSEEIALNYYSHGMQPAEIARQLSSEGKKISVATVNVFLDRARKKLGAKSRAHAVRLGIMSGAIV